MSENKRSSQKDKYGFYYEDYYNKEFDEYGFNKAGIYLKKGNYYKDIESREYHKYTRYCEINVYSDFTIVQWELYVSDEAKKTLSRYGWRYNQSEHSLTNYTEDLNFYDLFTTLKHDAFQKMFISLKKYDENFCNEKQNGDNEYDLMGYDKDGYNEQGYDRKGKDRNGYHRDGFNDYGFNRRWQSKADFSCNLIRDVLLNPQEIFSISHGWITKEDIVSYQTNEVIPSGLLCNEIFGDYKIPNDGSAWGIKLRSMRKLTNEEKEKINMFGMIPLCCKVVNPWFYKGVDSTLSLLTGIPSETIEEIAQYREYFVFDPGDSNFEKFSIISPDEFERAKRHYENYDIRTGAEALYEFVSQINLEEMLSVLKNSLNRFDPEGFNETDSYEKLGDFARQRVLVIKKKINVVNTFIDSGKSPLWMFFDSLPVIPIDLRPYFKLDGGRIALHDVNTLYRNVIHKNNFARSRVESGTLDGIINNAFCDVQNAVDRLFDNSICIKPTMSYEMTPLFSLKEIFFDRNGFFLDLLNGCDAKQNDYIIKDNKFIKYFGYDEKVIIQDGITEIDNDAFENCNNLKSICIPKSVEIIRENAFIGCKNLEEINLPQGIKSIELGTFSDCKSLKSIVIPPSVGHIDVRAFENCEELQFISIGSNVTISSRAFKGCKKLVNTEGYVIINNQLFDYYGTDTDIIIPSNVTEISSGAFSVSENVKTIIISSSICELNPFAFFSCKNLTAIVLPDNIERLPSDVLSLSKKLHSVVFPKTLKFIDKRAFMGCEELQEIKLPNGLKEIEDGAFLLCKKLSSVFIPESVIKIANNTFSGCKNLTIHTPKGSFAESYAKEKGIPLILE